MEINDKFIMDIKQIKASMDKDWNMIKAISKHFEEKLLIQQQQRVILLNYIVFT